MSFQSICSWDKLRSIVLVSWIISWHWLLSKDVLHEQKVILRSVYWFKFAHTIRSRYSPRTFTLIARSLRSRNHSWLHILLDCYSHTTSEHIFRISWSKWSFSRYTCRLRLLDNHFSRLWNSLFFAVASNNLLQNLLLGVSYVKIDRYHKFCYLLGLPTIVHHHTCHVLRTWTLFVLVYCSLRPFSSAPSSSS